MNESASIPALYPTALVAFTGETDIRWLRILRPGFRHVFVAVNDGKHWITFDPLSHRTEVAVQPVGADFDLASHYRRKGLRIVEVTPKPVRPHPAPIAICTCVEAAKRLLGIHDAFILTPWQLYRHVRLEPQKDHVISHQYRIFYMVYRIYSLIYRFFRAIYSRIAAAWRSACEWVTRVWDRVTHAVSTIFN